MGQVYLFRQIKDKIKAAKYKNIKFNSYLIHFFI